MLFTVGTVYLCFVCKMRHNVDTSVFGTNLSPESVSTVMITCMTITLPRHTLITGLNLIFWFLAKCGRWNSLQTQNCSHTWHKKGALMLLIKLSVPSTRPHTRPSPHIPTLCFSVDCYLLTNT